MRKNRGISLVEVVTGSAVMMLVTLGTMTLMASGLKSLAKTSTDVTLSDKNALGSRWVCEYARASMGATLSNNGSQVSFSLPTLSTKTDSVTGEKEFAFPLANDGVTRGFKVDFAAGTMTDLHMNKVLVKNIMATDPDPKSSNYGKSYAPFSFTMVGPRKAIVIQLITKDKIAGLVRYTRMKNTVLLRNISW